MGRRLDAGNRDRACELAFRAAHMLWARVGEWPGVAERRLDHFRTLDAKPIATSVTETRQFASAPHALCQWVADRWTALYDRWTVDRQRFVFDDAYAALLFARLMWANEPVLLRGHADQSWTLQTTLERARLKGAAHVEAWRVAAEQFLARLGQEPAVRRAYSGNIPAHHREAILQHYGFPTDLLDLTYSYDVALYFAEGGTDHLVHDGPEFGCLYAFPAWAIHSAPYTLAPGVMRPTLQRAAFVRGVGPRERGSLERFRLVFRHFDMPVWNGLGSIPFGSPVGLGKYLFPLSDPIEFAAADIRKSAADLMR